MSIIGEAILTVTVELLIEKLASELIQLFARQGQIEAGLGKWKDQLETIKLVLDDAEEKQITNPLVRRWLVKLQNLVYDAEDMLDEFATEAFRRNLLLLKQADPLTSKFRKLIPSCCTKFSPSSVKFDIGIASGIDEITARFEAFVKQSKDELHLIETTGGIRLSRIDPRPVETSLVDEAEVYGRGDDKEAIIGWLLRDDSSTGHGFSVIPISGMGGLGKTTLAQLVYNDVRVTSYFDFQAWVYVSEDFDAVRITKEAARSADDTSNLDLLQDRLVKQLKDKKFLLVLDDMWSENYDAWTKLCKPFKAGLPGSKIIVTTRHQRVSSMVTTTPDVDYSLENLSADDCFRVFAHHSLSGADFSQYPELWTHGVKIVDKCKGLPLAAKTLGGLLRGNKDPDSWKGVLDNKRWDLGQDEDYIMRVLRVSYYYLPSHVKRCFAYCSLLPKGYEFDETQVILLWLGEGLLQKETRGLQMEELGRLSFQLLHSMSFFQRSEGDTSRFLMHDLIHDLASWASGGEICSSMESKWDGNVRHISYLCNRFDGIKRFEGLHEIEHLRTFLALPRSLRKGNYVTGNLIYHTIPKLRRLRVLSLCRYWIYQLPSNIGELKHLRYLDISYNAMEVLPESVSTLYNLHTLILEFCYRLKKLFPDIGNLVNLRHLRNSHSEYLEEMPLRLSKLTSLRTLTSFVVGKENCSGLRELRPLRQLQGELTISSLENVTDVNDATEAELSGKEKLDTLTLQWGNRTTSSDEMQTGVLEKLKPSDEGLKELTIQGYGGTKFPIWLGHSSFTKLVLLRFEDCNLCTSLPSVGQLPSLKDLFIKGMAKVKSIGLEFSGRYSAKPFPSLETLRFEDMQEWEEWIPQEEANAGFPNLRELSIVRCPELKGGLPQHFSSLERIEIWGCEQLLVSYTVIPPLCELEIEGFSEVAWISISPPDCSSSVPEEEPKRAETILPWRIWITDQRSLTNDLHNQNHIASITMDGPDIYSFPETGLPTNLRDLIIADCKYLTTLPNGMYNLNCLERLDIRRCENLEFIPDDAGCPPKLTKLHISGRNVCSMFFELGFQNLTCLRELFIEDGLEDEVSFQQLPDSLVNLDVREFNQLESISFVQKLTALERLDLSRCPNLKSFAENNNGLPASLLTLDIYLCPYLEERCKKDGGDYWHFVADIPYVRLNHKLVFDPRS